MIARRSCCLLLALLIVPGSQAKDKKKASLSEIVLRARTVAVVIRPDAGEPLDNPRANESARDNVERALMAWGRLQPVMDGEEADLVIAVRTGSGRMLRPTLKGGPINSRPGVMQPTDSQTRIGAQQGQPPPLSDPTASDPRNRGPHITNEIGPSEDSFEVYLGKRAYPLDSSPTWRYIGKDCLSAPAVTAVEQFRKAMAEAEQLQQKKP